MDSINFVAVSPIETKVEFFIFFWNFLKVHCSRTILYSFAYYMQEIVLKNHNVGSVDLLITEISKQRLLFCSRFYHVQARGSNKMFKDRPSIRSSPLAIQHSDFRNSVVILFFFYFPDCVEKGALLQSVEVVASCNVNQKKGALPNKLDWNLASRWVPYVGAYTVFLQEFFL